MTEHRERLFEGDVIEGRLREEPLDVRHARESVVEEAVSEGRTQQTDGQTRTNAISQHASCLHRKTTRARMTA